MARKRLPRRARLKSNSIVALVKRDHTADESFTRTSQVLYRIARRYRGRASVASLVRAATKDPQFRKLHPTADHREKAARWHLGLLVKDGVAKLEDVHAS